MTIYYLDSPNAVASLHYDCHLLLLRTLYFAKNIRIDPTKHIGQICSEVSLAA
jgi:hypothetical protein